MASRYAVGGSFTWDASNTTNWSATSGGAGGASVPTSADDVFVDALSGSSPVILASGTLNCLSLDFTGAITPTFQGSAALNIFGSLTYISAMTMTHSGPTNFKATSTGKTITTALKTINEFVFAGVGGGWTFQDNVTTINGITLTNGALNTNGKTVSTSQISSSNTNVRSLNLGASIINLTGNWILTSVINMTFSAGTSTINMTSAASFFSGGGSTYNIVNLNGTSTTISGSNTIATLTRALGKTLNLTAGTNQSVTNLSLYGTLASPGTIQSVTAGSAATITLPTGRYFIRHNSIKDITISGATAVTSIAGTNVSGNTGITFVTKFEMGRIKNDGSFNWYSSATGTVDKVSG